MAGFPWNLPLSVPIRVHLRSKRFGVYSYSISNETVNVTATVDGAATADYLLQTTEDLVSSNWNTVGEFTSDTNFVLAATNSQGFYRTVGE